MILWLFACASLEAQAEPKVSQSMSIRWRHAWFSTECAYNHCTGVYAYTDGGSLWYYYYSPTGTIGVPSTKLSDWQITTIAPTKDWIMLTIQEAQ